MANWVKISCVSGGRGDVVKRDGWDAIFEQVEETWRGRVSQVLPDRPDIIVLPEECDVPSVDHRGLTAEERIEYVHHRHDRMQNMLCALARENGCYIVYPSLRLDTEGRLWNSMELLSREGDIVGSYNKNHLVIEENAERGVWYGATAPSFELDFGRVVGAICFDLNFNELLDQYIAAHPDLIVFSSAYHGGFVQREWAYRARAYLASCVLPPAPSAILSPLGEILATSTNYFGYVTTRVNLDRIVIHLDYNARKFGAIKSKYRSSVRIHDPGLLGSVLLTSESEDCTAMDISKEFELELLDDYLERARRHRRLNLGVEPVIRHEAPPSG